MAIRVKPDIAWLPVLKTETASARRLSTLSSPAPRGVGEPACPGGQNRWRAAQETCYIGLFKRVGYSCSPVRSRPLTRGGAVR